MTEVKQWHDLKQFTEGTLPFDKKTCKYLKQSLSDKHFPFCSAGVEYRYLTEVITPYVVASCLGTINGWIKQLRNHDFIYAGWFHAEGFRRIFISCLNAAFTDLPYSKSFDPNDPPIIHYTNSLLGAQCLTVTHPVKDILNMYTVHLAGLPNIVLNAAKKLKPLNWKAKVKAGATIRFAEPILSNPLLHVEDTCTKLDFSTLQIISVREGLPPQVQTKKMTKKRATSQALIDKRIDFFLIKTHYRKESSASEADESSSSTLRTQLEEMKTALHKAQQQITILLAERGIFGQTIDHLQNQLNYHLNLITPLQQQMSEIHILCSQLKYRMDSLEGQVSMYISDLKDDLIPINDYPFSGFKEYKT